MSDYLNLNIIKIKKMKKTSILILTLILAISTSAMIAPPPATSTTSTTKYNVTLSTKGAGKGYFTKTPAIEIGVGRATKVDKGTVLSITATPYTGSKFVSWGGDCKNTEGPTCKITIDGPKNIVATFANEEKAIGQTALQTVNATCAKAALEKRDSKITAAYQSFTTKWIATITTRTAAQKLAFDKTGTERTMALKTASNTASATQKTIMKELTNEKGAAKSIYRLEMKQCGYEDTSNDE